MRKYKIWMGVALIIVACLLLFYQFANKKENDTFGNAKETNEQIQNQDEEKEEEAVEQEEEKNEVTEETMEERIEPDLAEEYYVSEQFELLEVPDNVALEEEAKLKEAIQTYMYINGYAGFDHATYVGSQEIAYLGQVLVTIDIGANNEFRLQAIFDTEKKDWKIVTW